MHNLASLLFLVACLMATPAAAESAYILPVAEGWDVRPLLSVGQAAANGYRMVGGADGLGAYNNGDGTLTVLMNHEIPADKGMVRAHGAKGAFVSRWVIQLADLSIQRGDDLVRQVWLWDVAVGGYRPATAVAMGRFCSADLAPVSAFLDGDGYGSRERLLLNGEEEKDAGGRAFAHIVSGELAGRSYELPHLGRVAWENLLALPDAGRRTVVIGMDDFPGGHVYVYAGEKRNSGNPVEKAGLVGGALYAVRFEGGRFSLLPLGDVMGLDGKALRARARELGATPLLRPEDGAWDKRERNLFWFATTDKVDGKSQLFRMDFDDARRPELGGKFGVALTAAAIGGQMFDNLAADGDGRVLVEEDPGDNAYASGIWLYDPRQPNQATRIFQADPERFARHGSAAFMTEDEEQSGIVEVTDAVRLAPWFDAGRRYYLGVTQVHASRPEPELVEGGQLWLITGPASSAGNP